MSEINPGIIHLASFLLTIHLSLRKAEKFPVNDSGKFQYRKETIPKSRFCYNPMKQFSGEVRIGDQCIPKPELDSIGGKQGEGLNLVRKLFGNCNTKPAPNTKGHYMKLSYAVFIQKALDQLFPCMFFNRGIACPNTVSMIKQVENVMRKLLLVGFYYFIESQMVLAKTMKP